MKKIFRFSAFIFAILLAVILSSASVLAWDDSLNESSVDPDGSHQNLLSVCMMVKDKAMLDGYRILTTNDHQNDALEGASRIQSSFIAPAVQADALLFTFGLRKYLFSFRPDIKFSEDSHTREVFLVIHLDDVLSPGLTVMKNLEGGKYLADLLQSSPASILADSIRWKPNLSASYIKGTDAATAMTRNGEMVFKPLMRDPFHNGSISLSLPIPLTESLTVSPAITYAFSINDYSIRQEYRGKALFNLIDRDSAIVYTGIHLKYSF
jgi:hypothetical protein